MRERRRYENRQRIREKEECLLVRVRECIREIERKKEKGVRDNVIERE